MSPDKTIKCVVVGDGTVGKTCLLMRYAKDKFLFDYVPTVFDNYAATVAVGDEMYDFHLFDTAGQEDYSQLRKFTLENADIFIVCFSVVLWHSFINAREKWIPELQENFPMIPYILVGTKADLRYDRDTVEKLTAEGRSPITKEQGDMLAKELHATAYLECSALTRENVDSVFKDALYTAVSQKALVRPSFFRSLSLNNNPIHDTDGKKCSPCSAVTNCLRNNCVLM